MPELTKEEQFDALISYTGVLSSIIQSNGFNQKDNWVNS